jgi:phosphopantothenoylcysteine decarboxylase/phosphopantothenate--cysteine ligase
MAQLPAASVVVKTAAVADFRPAVCHSRKIKKGGEKTWLLEFERTPDILAALGEAKAHQILVGFAAETENLIDNARRKLADKNLDMVVANDVTQAGAGFGGDTNLVTFLFPEGEPVTFPCLSKEAVAHQLLDRIADLCRRRKKNHGRI